MTLEIQAAEPTTLPLEAITRDLELACRAAGVSQETAAEYAEAMRSGATFPPIVVFLDADGQHWLADGFHRCAAAELAGRTEIAVDLHRGGRRDALVHAAGSNASHGLRRTHADKRRAIELVLAAYPRWSDRKIALACGVHNETVGAVRKRVTDSVTPPEAPHEPAPTSDAVVARLTKALQRVVQEWPADRRSELHERLLEVATAPATDA